MSNIERWPIYVCPEHGCRVLQHGGINVGWRCPEKHNVEKPDIEYAVYERDYRGAVSLTDEQWERVLWWLHKPVPPGPAKALDVAIIRAINTQRGQ